MKQTVTRFVPHPASWNAHQLLPSAEADTHGLPLWIAQTGLKEVWVLRCPAMVVIAALI